MYSELVHSVMQLGLRKLYFLPDPIFVLIHIASLTIGSSAWMHDRLSFRSRDSGTLILKKINVIFYLPETQPQRDGRLGFVWVLC